MSFFGKGKSKKNKWIRLENNDGEQLIHVRNINSIIKDTKDNRVIIETSENRVLLVYKSIGVLDETYDKIVRAIGANNHICDLGGDFEHGSDRW